MELETRPTPFFFPLFDLAHFPWSDPLPEQIRLRRAALNDELIFDILLRAGGIDNVFSLYPPQDATALRNLLEAIEGTTYDRLKKDCLVYYLLKWQTHDRALEFSQRRSLPPQFVALSDAYWGLDTGRDVQVGYICFQFRSQREVAMY